MGFCRKAFTTPGVIMSLKVNAFRDTYLMH